MAGDPPVRILGHVEDVNGMRLAVGVARGRVLIGDPDDILGLSWEFTQEHMEQLGQFVVAACWEAAAQSTQYLPAQKGSLE